MTPLVIVCGPPASGKSTLAAAIGRQLRLPVISKDLIKERLMDDIGRDPNLGAAAFAVQFAMARELLKSGAGLVLEGAFFRDQREIAEVAGSGDTVVISVETRLEVLERRYVERHEERHPAHRGPEAIPDLREDVQEGEYGVPELARPTLRVDSTDGLNPSEAEILDWIRNQLEGGRDGEDQPGPNGATHRA
jgi:glucokinase